MRYCPILILLPALWLVPIASAAGQEMAYLTMVDNTGRFGLFGGADLRGVRLRAAPKAPVVTFPWAAVRIARLMKVDYTFDPGTRKVAKASPAPGLRLLGATPARVTWSKGGAAQGTLVAAVGEEILFAPQGAPRVLRYPAGEVSEIEAGATRIKFDDWTRRLHDRASLPDRPAPGTPAPKKEPADPPGVERPTPPPPADPPPVTAEPGPKRGTPPPAGEVPLPPGPLGRRVPRVTDHEMAHESTFPALRVALMGIGIATFLGMQKLAQRLARAKQEG